jgi:hypothetical protein
MDIRIKYDQRTKEWELQVSTAEEDGRADKLLFKATCYDYSIVLALLGTLRGRIGNASVFA